MQLILFNIRWQQTSNLLQSQLMRILWPVSCLCYSWFIGWNPRKSWHTSVQVFCVLLVIALPSIGSLRITSTSCNVMLTSPCGMWKVWVSRCHRSTKAVIRPWSISLPKTQRSPSKPSALMMLTTRSSTTGSRLENSKLRLRQVKVPRSYTEQNHGLIYDSCSIYIVWIKCMYIS